MSYCTTCGAELTPGARFCANCGAAVSTTSSTITTAPTSYGSYDLVLMDIGTCPQSQVDDVLQDLLGYSELDTIEILTALPTQIAQNLTQQQALYLAQALTEYGMEVAIYQGNNVVDLGSQATTTVYQSDGSFLKGVLATLATITLANKVKQFLRWTRPVPKRAVFVPRYTPKPPVHVRRPMNPAPQPYRPAPTPNRGMQAPRINRNQQMGGRQAGRGPQNPGMHGPGRQGGHDHGPRGGHR